MTNTVSAWVTKPDYKINITRLSCRIGILIVSDKIVISERVLLLSEQDYEPVYYFPRGDINMHLMHKIKKETFCPYKGKAEYWALVTDNTEIKVAAWSYPKPLEKVNIIKDYVAFYPDVLKHIVIN